jgi:benzoyl-CoA reductase/2-hydroxyglutaryl-CoA dehydratase subunit BcrC/BadD/HgdB
MKTVVYSSPFVPPEWIAAHRMRPRWVSFPATDGRPAAAFPRGVCPYAGAIIQRACSDIEADALVMTTACDQMRYAAALADRQGGVPVFLLNLPSTWQTAAAASLYRDELDRLGRFLVALGGRAPDASQLARVLLAHEDARLAVRRARGRLSARQFAQAIADVRDQAAPNLAAPSATEQSHLVPLALVGGPLLAKDYAVFDVVEQAGGRIVLDATETGERTLPEPLDRARVRDDPISALADAYFRGIPDVFRRPNHRLYEWLGEQLAARHVRGILLRRYVWCDLWHAELGRMRRWSPVPVLEFDVCEDDSQMARFRGRMEAFLETLKPGGAVLRSN